MTHKVPSNHCGLNKSGPLQPDNKSAIKVIIIAIGPLPKASIIQIMNMIIAALVLLLILKVLKATALLKMVLKSLKISPTAALLVLTLWQATAQVYCCKCPMISFRMNAQN